MLAFFYSLFYSIIRGQWVSFPYNEVQTTLGNLTNRLANLLVNALGGHFDTLQTFVFVDNTLPASNVIPLVLAVIATIMVCLLTFKLTKMVFSIFFGGR